MHTIPNLLATFDDSMRSLLVQVDWFFYSVISIPILLLVAISCLNHMIGQFRRIEKRLEYLSKAKEYELSTQEGRNK